MTPVICSTRCPLNACLAMLLSCNTALQARVAVDCFQKRTHEPEECEPKCHQLIRDHMLWCATVTQRRCRGYCLFNDVQDVIPAGTFDEEDTFIAKAQKIASAPLYCTQYCLQHQRMCPLFGPATEAHWETAGLPCPDQSRAGLRRFEQGPTAAVFCCHAKRHIEKQTPMILLENVQDRSKSRCRLDLEVCAHVQYFTSAHLLRSSGWKWCGTCTVITTTSTRCT